MAKSVQAATKRKGRKNRKLKNKLLRAITVLFCMGVIVCCIIGIILTFFVVQIIKDRASIDISNLDLNYTTIIYASDKHGNQYEVERVHSGENRIWTNIDELPDYIGNAAIAVEDQRFMKHSGVDFKRTFSAFVNEIFHIYSGRQGGSTITQQLVKNITGDNKVQALRKIREIISALFLEKRATKMEILEAYLNVIYLGYNTNGIEAAANLYFDKSAKDLTLREAVAIIAITRNPASYDLFLHPDANWHRSEYILEKMLEFKFITKAQFDEAVADKLVVSGRNDPAKRERKINSYFVDYLISDVVNSLVEKYGFTPQYATQQIYSGGYRIYSTLDERIQNILQERYENSSAFSRISGGKGDVQSAMVVLDHNGGIAGILGGRGKKTINRGLNRATDTRRQPGSAIKPISIYALAIEKNMLHYSSLVKDEPFQELNGKKWPRNAYGSYYGNMLLPSAVSQSSNAAAVQVCDQMNPASCFNFMKNKLAINSLIESNVINGRVFTDKTLASMALGALTEGMNVLELTAAYQIFVNGGLYTKPHAYSKVVDSRGNVVLEVSSQAQRVISKSTAEVMNRLLQGVITGGTGRGAQLGNFAVAGKTGTTSDDKDAWFVGATPHYIGGVWVGYDSPHEMQHLWPNYPPTVIWREVMAEIHKDLAAASFARDQGVVAKEYCKKTGLLATSTCFDHATGYYRAQNIPGTCHGRHEVVPQLAEQDGLAPVAGQLTETAPVQNTQSSEKPQNPAATESKPTSVASPDAGSSQNDSKPVVKPLKVEEEKTTTTQNVTPAA